MALIEICSDDNSDIECLPKRMYIVRLGIEVANESMDQWGIYAW